MQNCFKVCRLNKLHRHCFAFHFLRGNSTRLLSTHIIAGFHKYTFHSFPLFLWMTCITKASHHLILPRNRPTVSFTRATKIGTSFNMFKANKLVTTPKSTRTYYLPVVKMVPLTILSIAANFLLIWKWRTNMMAVKVSSSANMGKPNFLPTFYRSSSHKSFRGWTSHLPVAVGINFIVHSCNRLLATAWPILDVMWM